MNKMNFMLVLSFLLAIDSKVNGDCSNIAASARRDCGNVQSTQTSCLASNCCWYITPGAPYCFFPTNTTANTTIPSVPTTVGLKVYIHIMPWFETKASNEGKWGAHWTMANQNPDLFTGGKRNIASKFHPLIDCYASGDPDVIDWQLGLMKLSGAKGVLIDWPGTANVYDYAKNKQNSSAIIAGCQRHGLEFAIVYEDHNLGIANQQGKVSDIIGQGKADMTYLRDNYFTNSLYTHVNRAPLLLDFGPQTLKGSQWGDIFSVFSQKPTFLTLWYQIQDTAGAAIGEFAWIYSDFLNGLNHFYANRNLNFKFGVAYPGFDTFYAMGGWPGPSWVIPVGVNTFQQTLDAAFSGAVNYVQLSTWNDYGEGTMIEPTLEFGYSFLITLQSKLGVPFTQADLETVTELYNQRKQFQDNAAKMAQLDQAFQALVALRPDVARSILSS